MRLSTFRLSGVIEPAIGLVFLLTATLTACGSDTTDDPPTSATIGSSGGELEADGLRLVVPPGALDSETALTVTRTSASAPAGYEAFSPVFEFGPDGLTFAEPVTVEIAFEGEPAAAQLFWSSDGGAFSPAGGTVEASTLRAEITHFSSGFVGTFADPDATPDAGPGPDATAPDATAPDTVDPTDAGTAPGIPDDVMSACAFVHMCSFTTFPDGLSGVVPSCVEDVMDARMGMTDLPPAHLAFIERIVGCGGDSGTCDDFRSCVHGGEIVTCSGPQDDRCERRMAVECRHSSDAFPTLFECDDDACTQCGSPTPQSDGESCSSAGEAVCNGDVVEECSGTLFTTDCAAAGMICVDPPGEGSPARCMASGTELCEAEGAPTCEGDTLVYCDAPFVTRFDCGAAGLECSTTAGCVAPPPGDECEDLPAERGGTCDGDAVVMCMNGRILRVPCSTVGRSACEQMPSIAVCSGP